MFVCVRVYTYEYIYVTLNFVPFPLLSPYHVTHDALALEESIYVTGHQAEGYPPLRTSNALLREGLVCFRLYTGYSYHVS